MNWGSFLDIARRCPSPHNTQPWKARVLDDDTLLLCVDRARTLPDEDVTGCFIWCAMGMFVESVRIVAANAGIGVEFVPAEGRHASAHAPELVPFGVLRRTGASPPDAISNDLFLRRSTGRLHPEPRPVSTAHLQELCAIAAPTGQRFGWIKEPAHIKSLLDLNTLAVVEDLNSRHYHDEIVRWFRFGDRHADRTRDGLSSRCMNMSAVQLRAAARFPRVFRLPIVGPALRWWYRHKVGPAETIAFVAGAFWDRDSATAAGAALIRLWLEMERRDLRIHPFGNLVTNRDVHARVSRVLGVDDAWLIFRVAHTAPPPASLRLTKEEILHDAFDR